MISLLSKLGGWKGYTLVAIGAAAATFSVMSAYHDADELKQLQAWLGLRDAKIEEGQKADAALAEKEVKTEIVYRDRVKEVIKYVKSHDDRQCLDDSGLQLYRKALRGAITSKVPDKMP